MKRKIYTLIFSFFIISCSSNSDDNNDLPDNNSTNALLVSKITYNYSETPDYSYEEEFTYDGNKISEILKITYSNGSVLSTSKTFFAYENDLISRIDFYDSNKFLTLVREFKYDSQSRITDINECIDGNCPQECNSPDGNCTTTYHYSSSFSYNSDGSVSLIETDNNENKEYKRTLKLDNQGNIVDISSKDGDCEVETSLVYDNKNSPFKNVIGANFFNYHDSSFSDSPTVGFYNNLLSYKDNSICNNIPYKLYYSRFLYDYNQEEYPIKIVHTDTDGSEDTASIEYK